MTVPGTASTASASVTVPSCRFSASISFRASSSAKPISDGISIRCPLTERVTGSSLVWRPGWGDTLTTEPTGASDWT